MDQALRIVNLALYALLAFKLWKSDLHKVYRWLFIYAIFSFVRAIIPIVFGWTNYTNAYALWWAIGEPIYWFLLTVLVLDLCTAVFHQFPALTTWGSRIYKSALVVSVGISLVGLLLSAPPEDQRRILIILAVQRVVLTGLLVIILALLFAMAWFRVPLKRNTLALAGIFFAYFLSKAGASLVMQSIGLQVRGQADLVMKLIVDLCLIGWIVLLTPAGEKVVLRVGHQWNPEEGERLVRQLGALNQSLAERAGRSSAGVARD